MSLSLICALQATRSISNSSVSCTDDSCSVCSPKTKRGRSRSTSRSHAIRPTNSNSRPRHMGSPSSHGTKVNGRNGPSTFSSASTTSMIPNNSASNSGHHSKQRPPSPLLRDEEKRRNHDDKWKMDGGGDKLARDRTHSERHTRAPPYTANDHSAHEPSLNKHSSMSSRLSKSSRAPSLEYVRMKSLNEQPVLPIGAKKKPSKDKPVDKVSLF